MGRGTDKARGSSGTGSRGRWSAVDTVILLMVVIALGAQLWQAILVNRETEAEKTPTVYEVTFTVPSVRREVLEEIQAFDGLYLYEDGTRIGSVGQLEDEEGRQYIALTPVEPGPDGITGSVYVSAEGCMMCTEGELRDGGLLIPECGLLINPGSELTVRTDKVLLNIRVESIRAHD